MQLSESFNQALRRQPYYFSSFKSFILRVIDMKIKERSDSDLIICSEKNEYDAAQSLISEYVDALDLDLSFQDIQNELENLQNFYGPPTGMIILAKDGEEFIGEICIRNMGEFMAEIRRMYVKPDYRGKGIGRKLLDRARQEAKGLGYRFLRLDTIPEMESAIHLYISSGFYEIESYAYSPLSGTKFLEYKL